MRDPGKLNVFVHGQVDHLTGCPSLSPQLAADFRDGTLAGLQRMHDNGGITLDDIISFTRVLKP